MRQLRAGIPKRRAAYGVNGKQRRNKQRRLRLPRLRRDTTFVLFQAVLQSEWKHSFRVAFFGSFLGGTRNEQWKKDLQSVQCSQTK